MLCLSVGCKGENDDLESVGLVRRGARERGWTRLQKLVGRKQRPL